MGKKRRNKTALLAKVPLANLEHDPEEHAKATKIQVAEETARYKEEQRKRAEGGWSR